MFQCLLRVIQSSRQDEDNSVNMAWRPFEGRNTTEILKATTCDIAGVAMTIMDLRTAAESYADIVGQADMQRALSFAEGHTERIAKQYYKRNGSTTLLKPWLDHIEELIHGQESSNNGGEFSSVLDEEIDKRMKLSQQKWKEEIVKKIHDSVDNSSSSAIKHKRRQDWSSEEDAELRRLLRIYGKGNWKEILEHSSILQERYRMAPTGMKSA